MSDQQNLFMAVILSIAVLVGWQYFIEAPRIEAERARQAALEQSRPEAVAAEAGFPAAGTPIPGRAAPVPDGALPAPDGPPPATPEAAALAAAADRLAVIAGRPHVAIRSERLNGSIALQGGRIDDLSFSDYWESLDPESDTIVLFSPAGTEHPYFAEFGWTVTPGTAVKLPNAATVWRPDGSLLSPDRPVTLSWDNGQGLRFSRTYEIDEDYLFTVTQRVANSGTNGVTLYPYGLISRLGTPEISGFFILHEGALGVFDGTLEEMTYEDMRDEESFKGSSTGGWAGITDKYWLAALIPDQNTPVNASFRHSLSGAVDRYHVDFLTREGLGLAPGGSIQSTSRLFAGPKEVDLVDRYETVNGIDRFDLAIDWGWFYFLTKPLFYVLDFLFGAIGNFGVAILLLTVGIKLLFFPLANKSYVAMSKMKKLQPEMVKIRERFKDDKTRQQQALMELYKKEQVNPAAGCLPIMVQIPVFFALYKVLFVSIEMRHAPFYGWIHDLSAPDPMVITTLFGLIPWDPPQLLAIGIWPLLMGASMFIQQKLNPQPADPVQARVFMIMPFMFMFLLASFPAGLVIYWTWNNVLSIAQQWVIMRRMGVKV